MARIIPDDSKRFLWGVWIGDYLWSRCRTLKAARWIKARLENAIKAAAAEGSE